MSVHVKPSENGGRRWECGTKNDKSVTTHRPRPHCGRSTAAGCVGEPFKNFSSAGVAASSSIVMVRLMLELVLAAEPQTEAEEVGFVDGVEHFHRRSLNKLVFERRDAGDAVAAARPPWECTPYAPASPGTLRASVYGRGSGDSPQVPRRSAATSLRPHRLRRASSTGSKQTAECGNTGGCCDREKSGELHILVQCCRLSYLRQRTGRVDPALSPERVLLAQVPLGQTPSLHLLRRRCSGFVRRLPRYYGSVRLPVFVRHRLLSLDFPMRPENAGLRENPGSLNYRARCVPTCQGHRPRRTPTKLAMALGRMLPSALCQGVGVLKFGVFRGSITWPVVPPVYASYPALRPCPQDSEPDTKHKLLGGTTGQVIEPRNTPNFRTPTP